MSRPGFQLGAQLFDELVVDNFAGGGGASIGIEHALGRAVDVAINHDPEAVALHRANHPATRHLCQDVFAARPTDVTGGRPVGLAWFSPDCTYFSKARGGKPIRDVKRRDLAWVVIRWAKTVRPRVILLENVEEFRTWGPLTPEGRPCPERRGRTFGRWVRELRAEGYEVDWRELRACDYGAPTTRKRLFLVARCDGAPIAWPEPSHGPGKRRRYRTAAECLDWSVPVPSIFGRPRPLAEATLRRIAVGTRRYILDDPQPFTVSLRGTAASNIDASATSLGAPLRTITSGGSHHALVAPYGIPRHGEREGQTPRCRSMQRPAPTVTGTANGMSLVAAWLAKHYGGVIGHRPDRSIGTLTTRDHHALAVAQLDPRADRGVEVAALIDRLAPGAVRRDAEGRLVVSVDSQEHALVDLGMRMLEPVELFRCQGFPANYVVDRGVDELGATVALTKATQTRLCGNSVAPPVVEALVRANVLQEVTS